jgi:2-polyprenyl-3-methyl-5-hydroxy-6-metoxy-1,4-benzoquinol methylase
MTEFWENAFQTKHKMWGEKPCLAAVEAAAQCKQLGFQSVLIPGMGYGRNAKPFLDAGLAVTGVEISETAIRMGQQMFGSTLKFIHGSVTDTLGDATRYDAVFCHALIHLLDSPQRKKLFADCVHQLNAGGIMVFTAITQSASTYGVGTPLGPARFRTAHGVDLFFYDESSIQAEFASFGLQHARRYYEPVEGQHAPGTEFWNIECRVG